MTIKCVSCRYARKDENTSNKNWTAYECGNPDSEYHRCLLNITPSGEKQDRITWNGCGQGERRGA